MNLRAALIVAAGALTGCSALPAHVETVEVKIPVPVRLLPPPELYANPPALPLPEWVPSGDPRATSCVTADGERQLKALLLEPEARRHALKAWADRATPASDD